MANKIAVICGSKRVKQHTACLLHPTDTSGERIRRNRHSFVPPASAFLCTG